MKKLFPYLFVLAVPVAAAIFLLADRAEQAAQPRDQSVSISQQHAFSAMVGQRSAQASDLKPGNAKVGKTDVGKPVKTAALRIGDPAPAMEFTSLDGKKFDLAQWRGKLPLVMLADTTCPCVRAYDKRMKALAEKFPDLRIVYVFPSPLESGAQVQKFATSHAYPWPVVHDANQPIMAALGGSCTTESFLFDRTGTLRYHGRIDDNIYDEENVHVRDLETSVQAVIDGKIFVKTEVPAFGCVIPRQSGAPAPKTSKGKPV